jgi:hypothetical protein
MPLLEPVISTTLSFTSKKSMLVKFLFLLLTAGSLYNFVCPYVIFTSLEDLCTVKIMFTRIDPEN